jgi:hypothetical protein
MYTLTEKLWYTADMNAVVKDGDPKAAFLLGLPGHMIDDDEAERLGLKAAAKAAAPKANKRAKTQANKRATKRSTKNG